MAHKFYVKKSHKQYHNNNNNNNNDDYKSQSKWVKKKENDKHYYRNKVWNYMENNNIALFPRPVYNRIPNFINAEKAANNLLKIPCFVSAKNIKVNPDKPQQNVRYISLKMNKKLLIPTPRLKSNGLLNEIIVPYHLKNDDKTLRMASTRKGLQKFGHLLSLNQLKKWKMNNGIIDICIVGSVAVDKNGHRIGKGEGYADLEIAILNEFGLINNNTKFIATVHDCQVFDTLQDNLFDITDVILDYICTPTQIIEIKREKNMEKLPYKINWDKLDQDRINEMPVIKHLLSSNKQQTKYKSHKVTRW